MGRSGERIGLWSRSEDAAEHGSLGVSGPEAGMEAEELIELLDQIVGQG
jgi:hypothetical protein